MTVADARRPLSAAVSRIVSELKNRIQSGQYKAGEWLPTERELAADFKVSRILIRSAVQELERLELIACAAHRRPLVLDTPSESASVSSRSIALWIWPNTAWPSSGAIIQGIQEMLGNEFRLVLGSPAGGGMGDARASEARFLRQIGRDRDVEGLILDNTGGDSLLPLLHTLREEKIPMVFLDHLPPAGFEADYVGVNNKRGAELAVRHLLSLGHRRIAHVSNFDPISTVAERLSGYRRALESAGIPFQSELVEKDPGPPGSDPEKGCEDLVSRLLALPDPPTAIFALNDVAALRVIAALRVHGRRVPDDISVVGFDGIERWMPSIPFLTTVCQPFDRMGAQAVELLLERLQGGVNTPIKHVILDVSLSVNGSTKPQITA